MPEYPAGGALVEDPNAVHRTGNETIAGTKAFQLAPTVPAGAFGEDRIANLLADLAAKAADAAVVHLAGTETITGIKTSVVDALFKSGKPHRDMDAWGADPTGATQSTDAVMAAFTSLPATGGCLDFGEGKYYCPPTVANPNGLTFAGKPVRVGGKGGTSQIYAVGDQVRSPTVIYSDANAPIIVFTEAAKASLPSQYSVIANVGVLGSGGANANQHGVTVDNRGMHGRNVTVGGVGGDPWHIFDCVGGSFINCTGTRSVGHQWVIDPTQGTGGSAVTDTTFVNCSGNGGTGQAAGKQAWLVQGPCQTLTWAGGLATLATDYGMKFDAVAGNAPRWCVLDGVHVEGNGTGPVLINSAAVVGNDFRFGRLDGPIAFGAGVSQRLNDYSYIDLSQTGTAQVRKRIIGNILNWAGLNSGDIGFVTTIRQPDDSGDGRLRMRDLVLTFGLAAAAGTRTSDLAVPQGVDAVNLPNNRGLTWRNAANTGNIQGFYVTNNDEVFIGPGLAAGKNIYLGGVLNLNGQNVAAGTVTGSKIGTATGQKLGFWGVAPVVQQVLATGAGHTVDDVITLLQTLGLCKQS